MNKTPSQQEIASTLAHLQLSATTPQKPAHPPKSKPVADSWDLESSSSGSDTETEALDPISTVASHESSPNPPPPTPASPTPFDFPGPGQGQYDHHAVAPPRGRGVALGGAASIDKRPEKTTAVAGRLIAGALGVRAPKRSEEEREFDRVVKDKERRKRTEEKARLKREDEERENRKKAIWDD
ncbi:hypothetical protein ACEQ8H_004234 [Pleosporales sp. CAS-2024a]